MANDSTNIYQDFQITSDTEIVCNWCDTVIPYRSGSISSAIDAVRDHECPEYTIPAPNFYEADRP